MKTYSEIVLIQSISSSLEARVQFSVLLYLSSNLSNNYDKSSSVNFLLFAIMQENLKYEYLPMFNEAKKLLNTTSNLSRVPLYLFFGKLRWTFWQHIKKIKDNEKVMIYFNIVSSS